MAYTTDDLSEISRAIVELGAGKRVVRVSKGDGMIEYGQASLIELRSIETALITSLNAARGKRSCLRVATSKGL